MDNGSVVARTVAGRSLEGGADRRPGPACQIRTRWGGVPGVVRWTGTRGKHLLLRQVSLRELINKRRPVSPPLCSDLPSLPPSLLDRAFFSCFCQPEASSRRIQASPPPLTSPPPNTISERCRLPRKASSASQASPPPLITRPGC